MKRFNIVPQKKFETVEEFKRGSNNFYLYFVGDCWMTEEMRKQKCFQRFRENYPERAERLTLVVGARAKKFGLGRLPWKQLFKAYEIMSYLVYVGDEGVVGADGILREDFICR